MTYKEIQAEFDKVEAHTDPRIIGEDNLYLHLDIAGGLHLDKGGETRDRHRSVPFTAKEAEILRDKLIELFPLRKTVGE